MDGLFGQPHVHLSSLKLDSSQIEQSILAGIESVVQGLEQKRAGNDTFVCFQASCNLKNPGVVAKEQGDCHCVGLWDELVHEFHWPATDDNDSVRKFEPALNKLASTYNKYKVKQEKKKSMQPYIRKYAASNNLPRVELDNLRDVFVRIDDVPMKYNGNVRIRILSDNNSQDINNDFAENISSILLFACKEDETPTHTQVERHIVELVSKYLNGKQDKATDWRYALFWCVDDADPAKKALIADIDDGSVDIIIFARFHAVQFWLWK